ncbi:hypothetical protein Y032_0080g1332 [Ancylostoma ceylanicum]|uniref:Uncharacterized protein n=1 Tax=Ancylostoma ceylanicum TaxID=53326 RepID=A0A016TRP7_9BILA|nr:hypothetical protein Y032_0080g1332 [Ancylostoma ceylanicum]
MMNATPGRPRTIYKFFTDHCTFACFCRFVADDFRRTSALLHPPLLRTNCVSCWLICSIICNHFPLHTSSFYPSLFYKVFSFPILLSAALFSPLFIVVFVFPHSNLFGFQPFFDEICSPLPASCFGKVYFHISFNFVILEGHKMLRLGLLQGDTERPPHMKTVGNRGKVTRFPVL